MINNFGIRPSMFFLAGGDGFYCVASFFQHSCDPNIIQKETLGSAKVFIAKEDIKKGDQLYISYTESGETLKSRRHILKSVYGFDCKCSRCEREMESSQMM